MQGQEMDNEIKGEGNSISFSLRMYDPRLNRFMSSDPLFKSFPWNSPYAISENRLIEGLDLEGGEYEWFMINARAGIYGETVQKIQRGLDKSVYKTVNGIVYIAQNPGEAAKGAGNFLVANVALGLLPPGDRDMVLPYIDEKLGTSTQAASQAFEAGVNESADKIINGGLEDRAEVFFDVLTAIVGTKGTTAAVNVGKLKILTNIRKYLPKNGTLSNLEARVWYFANEAKIPKLTSGLKTLKEQAKKAFDLRNKFRSKARDLMADQKLAGELRKSDPNLTWNQIVEKTINKLKKKGIDATDNNIYKEIVESSQRSRQSVNKKLGIDKK